MSDSSYADPPTPRLSVLVTCYHSASALDEMVRELDRAMQELGWTYEIILVDDASTDNTFEKVAELFEQVPSITHAIQLVRNAGQTFAMTPGIVAASGRYLGIIDSDLQYDPRDLQRLALEIEKGYDIVSGYRTERHDPLYRRVASYWTSVSVRFISGLPLRDYGCSLKVLDKRILDAFEYSPMRPFHPLAALLAGGRLANVPVKHRARKHGRSGWKLIYLWYYFVDMLIVLLQRPTHLAGLACLALGAITAAAGLLSFAIIDAPPAISNYTLMLLATFSFFILSGTAMATLSLLLRTFLLTMSQPAYVERQHLQRPYAPRDTYAQGEQP